MTRRQKQSSGLCVTVAACGVGDDELPEMGSDAASRMVQGLGFATRAWAEQIVARGLGVASGDSDGGLRLGTMPVEAGVS
ncbi:hypothetical protein M0R45_008751 [Rubus argutus]|uniref:Uncharacterized protein n=1 Tax=Rubus argutus TaxID=59490 RepID=A0AAW1Y2N3_RUBAR